MVIVFNEVDFVVTLFVAGRVLGLAFLVVDADVFGMVGVFIFVLVVVLLGNFIVVFEVDVVVTVFFAVDRVFGVAF